MQFSLRVVTQPHPGVWPRVLVTIIIIVILAAAGWAWWVGLIFWTRWKAARRWFDRRTLVED